MWPFVTKKMYNEEVARVTSLNKENSALWNLYNVTNSGYKELEAENRKLREENLDLRSRHRSDIAANKAPLKQLVEPKKNQIMRSSEAPAESRQHVVFLGDTFSPSVMDMNPIVGSGGSFGGGGASASWSDDKPVEACSASYGGTYVSDSNSCTSTDSTSSNS